MAQPKKQSSPRKTGLRRSHLLIELAKRVNRTSPVKARRTTKQSGKKLAEELASVKQSRKTLAKTATK